MKLPCGKLGVWVDRNPIAAKIFENISWLLLDRAIRMFIGLFVGIWLARYLGPSEFGQLSFAVAFVSLFAVISTMGLNSIVVRDLVQRPSESNETLGAAFAIQFVGGTLATTFAIIVASVIQPDDSQITLFIVVLSFSLLFKPTEVIKYWYESQVRSRYVVWIESVVILASAAAKVLMILIGAELLSFIWLALIEAGMIGFGLVLIYLYQEPRTARWRVSLRRIGVMLEESWPLILSGVAIIIYMRTDQIMIGKIIGDEPVGVYSAALRISELWYMLPIIISGSAVPVLVGLYEQDADAYFRKLQNYFGYMFAYSAVVGAAVSIFSPWIIGGLFGSAYLDAVSILRIHVWTGVFVGMGVLSGHWFLLMGLSNHLLYRTLIGSIVNVSMNYFLIPRFGGVGAAWATLVSQLVSAYLFDFMFNKSRILFYMKSKSMLFVLKRYRRFQ